jgi:hypothetical protein
LGEVFGLPTIVVIRAIDLCQTFPVTAPINQTIIFVGKAYSSKATVKAMPPKHPTECTRFAFIPFQRKKPDYSRRMFNAQHIANPQRLPAPFARGLDLLLTRL